MIETAVHNILHTPQYTALIETILVLLRVFSVLAVPVLAVTTGRNTASTEHYPQYSSLK